MRVLKIFCIFILSTWILLVLSGCYLLPPEEEVLPPPLVRQPVVRHNTIEVNRGDIEHVIRGAATFVSIEQEALFFTEKGGRLEGIHISPGMDVKEGALVAELENDDIKLSIERQRLFLEREKIRYQMIVEREGSRHEKRLAQIEIELQEMIYDSLLKIYENSRLYSTVNGKVVWLNTALKPGDTVESHQEIAVVANPEKIQLEYIGPFYRDLKPGMEVDILIGGEQYTGRVVMTPEHAPADAEPGMQMRVLFEVDQLPDGIVIGNSVIFSVSLFRKEDVIVLPREAIRRGVNVNYVRLLENGIVRERAVEIGLETQTEFEIVAGLNEGDKVILR